MQSDEDSKQPKPDVMCWDLDKIDAIEAKRNAFPPYYWSDPDAIVTAAYEGHTDYIQRLLEEGADPNQKNGDEGNTALIEAAKLGYTPIIELLLKYGADINLPAKNGDTAVQVAKYAERFSEKKETVEFLLANGAFDSDEPCFEDKVMDDYADAMRIVRQKRWLISDFERRKGRKPNATEIRTMFANDELLKEHQG